MKEIKTVEMPDIVFQAKFEDGVLKQFDLLPSGEGHINISIEDLPKLVSWLQTTVLGKSPNIPVQEQKKVLDTPHDELSQRRVINPALSGVQVFDNSDKLSKANTVKFTIPNKS